MKNHALESLRGSKYNFSPDAALPHYSNVLAAEHQTNQTAQNRLKKLGHTALGWLRTKFRRTDTTQQKQSAEIVHFPEHALAHTPEAGIFTNYTGRHRVAELQPTRVHRKGEEGLYRSVYAAETAPTLAEVVYLRDAMQRARRQPLRGSTPNDFPSFKETLPPVGELEKPASDTKYGLAA